MKRVKLIQHVQKHHCVLAREGARHRVFRNALTGQSSSVPRHREIDDFLAKKICRDLGIPIP